jgi:hypothetical protein
MIVQANIAPIDAARQRLEQAYNIEDPGLDAQRSGFFMSYAMFPLIAIGAIAFAAWELFG